MHGTVTDASDTHMQIGQVAARTELSIRTIRHYDEVGLVTPSARSSGGFRLYTEADVERLLVIRRMKPLDFTLIEMKDLLDAYRHPQHPKRHPGSTQGRRRLPGPVPGKNPRKRQPATQTPRLCRRTRAHPHHTHTKAIAKRSCR